jgi:hypothetical protein
MTPPIWSLPRVRQWVLSLPYQLRYQGPAGRQGAPPDAENGLYVGYRLPAAPW